jgi:hypothetical protein
MWPLEVIIEMNRVARPGEPTTSDNLPIPKRRDYRVDPVKGFLRRKALLGGKAPRGTYLHVVAGMVERIPRHNMTNLFTSDVPISFDSFRGEVLILIPQDTIYWREN